MTERCTDYEVGRGCSCGTGDAPRGVASFSSPCQVDRTNTLLCCVRVALIMVLGAVEDYLGMARTIPGKAQRRAAKRAKELDA